MKKEKKAQVVEELKEKLEKAKSLVLTDYRGLTHRQLEDLKKALKAVGGEFLVTKNTLLRLAGGKKEELESYLKGPTATLFAFEDELAPFSVLAQFIKTFGLPQIKGGLWGKKILTSAEVLRLASIPSRQVLLATLVVRLKSPVYRLHYGLNYNLQKLVLVLQAKSKIES